MLFSYCETTNIVKFCRLLLILCLPCKVMSIGIQLEGIIDLGPKWNYVYKLSPIDKISNENKKSNEIPTIKDYNDVNNVLRTREDSASVDNDSGKVNINDLEKQHSLIDKEYADSSKLLCENDNNEDKNLKSKKDHKNKSNKKKSKKLKKSKDSKDIKVKDNEKIYNFGFHVLKQSLNVFESMKKLSSKVEIKNKIKALKSYYIEKFGDFLKESKDHKLKTKLAEQNFVLNSIDKSHGILLRLVNHLFEDGTRTSGPEQLFQKEIKKLRNVELAHACKKLKICRANYEFSDFLVKFLSIILDTNDAKIKQSADALTETIKTTDFTDIIEQKTQNELNNLMNKIEIWDPFVLRAMFLVIKRVIVARNEPKSLMSLPDVTLLNRTVSFNEFIDILNRKMATPDNKKEWREIIKNTEDWRDGKNKDIQMNFEKVIRQISEELKKLDYEMRRQISAIMKTLLSSIRPLLSYG